MTTGSLVLTVAQYRALGSTVLPARIEVTLADSSAALASLSVAEIAALDDKGIDRIDARQGALSLSVDKYLALGTVKLTASDQVTLADSGANLAGLSPAALAALASKGIDRIDATDNALALSVAQYRALSVDLTASDRVTLADTGAALAGLSVGQIKALGRDGIDAIDATDNVVTFSLAQLDALASVDLAQGDSLTVTGTSGRDRFELEDRLSADDRLDGRGGTDELALDGDYGAGVVLGDTTLVNIEEISLARGHDYGLTLADGTVAAGRTLTVDAGRLGAHDRLVLDGSAERNGHLVVEGGDGDDTIVGGGQADRLDGGAGDDHVSGGGGVDTVRGGRGDDVVDGGAGSDDVRGGRGDDLAIWRGAENAGSRDFYSGGHGNDTLRLDLTAAQYASQAVQAEIAAYRAFLADGPHPGGHHHHHHDNHDGHAGTFTFATLGLTVRSFEALEVLVDGAPPVTNRPPTATADSNAADAVVEAGAGAGDATAAGNVLANDSDPDAGDSLSIQGVAAGTTTGPLTGGVGGVIAGTYGTIAIAADGSYSYTLNDTDADTQALAGGAAVNDVFTYTVRDAAGATATATISIAIQGANDGAVITGTASGDVVEDGAAVVTGDLDATDVDSAAGFVAQDGVAAAYGSFSIDASGAWTYALDNTNAAVDALNVGGVLHDLITVATADGTSRVIDIAIHGADDAAAITGTAAATIAENTDAITGDLDVVDVDNAASFVAQTGAVGSYGSFSIDATGTWTYTLDNGNPAVDALNVGGMLHEQFMVATTGGGTQAIDVAIAGANDAAVITGTDGGFVWEGYGFEIAAWGNLDVTDVDSPAAFVPQTGDTTYGFFHINASGDWLYYVRDENPVVDGMTYGDFLTDSIMVSTADGTTHQVNVVIGGNNDQTVITGTNTGSVTEDGALTTSGDLDATDVDTAVAFVPETAVLAYGSFSVDETGAWTYTLDNANPAVQALAAGETLEDAIGVWTTAGFPYSRNVYITINGADEAAPPANPPANPPAEAPANPPANPPAEAPANPPANPPAEAPANPPANPPAEPAPAAPAPAAPAPAEPAPAAPASAAAAPAEPAAAPAAEPAAAAAAEPAVAISADDMWGIVGNEGIVDVGATYLQSDQSWLMS